MSHYFRQMLHCLVGSCDISISLSIAHVMGENGVLLPAGLAVCGKVLQLHCLHQLVQYPIQHPQNIHGMLQWGYCWGGWWCAHSAHLVLVQDLMDGAGVDMVSVTVYLGLWQCSGMVSFGFVDPWHPQNCCGGWDILWGGVLWRNTVLWLELWLLLWSSFSSVSGSGDDVVANCQGGLLVWHSTPSELLCGSQYSARKGWWTDLVCFWFVGVEELLASLVAACFFCGSLFLVFQIVRCEELVGLHGCGDCFQWWLSSVLAMSFLWVLWLD